MNDWKLCSNGFANNEKHRFDALELNIEPRVEFNQKFNRDNTINEMVLDILRFTKENA